MSEPGPTGEDGRRAEASPPPAAGAKIFGIGLRKTGTRSLASACRTLGYRTLHKGGRETSDQVVRAERSGRPLLTYLGDGYDVYFDVEALVHRFEVLDVQHPGSRFILSTRNIEDWLNSLERHVLANQERHARGEYHGDLLVVDRDAWRVERAEHHRAVREHFAQRPEALLEIDVCRGEAGWEDLAPFLGKAIPTTPFPWENRDGAGTYRKGSIVAGARRTAVGLRRRVDAGLRSR